MEKTQRSNMKARLKAITECHINIVGTIGACHIPNPGSVTGSSAVTFSSSNKTTAAIVHTRSRCILSTQMKAFQNVLFLCEIP